MYFSCGVYKITRGKILFTFVEICFIFGVLNKIITFFFNYKKLAYHALIMFVSVLILD